MPEQVWRTEDGQHFKTEVEASRHERLQVFREYARENPFDWQHFETWAQTHWHALEALVNGPPIKATNVPLGDFVGREGIDAFGDINTFPHTSMVDDDVVREFEGRRFASTYEAMTSRPDDEHGAP